jgi:hypothetical protein
MSASLFHKKNIAMKKLMLWIALVGMGSGVFAQTTTTPAPKANTTQENKTSDKSSAKATPAPSAKSTSTPTAKATPPKKENKKHAEHKDTKTEKKAPETK